MKTVDCILYKEGKKVIWLSAVPPPFNSSDLMQKATCWHNSKYILTHYVNTNLISWVPIASKHSV